MEKSIVNIIDFNENHAYDFAQLNFEWLENYFYIEEYDKKVLSNPKKYILDEGGHILVALIEEKVVGTVALLKRENGIFELSKMAVTEKYQGLRIGQKLMYACIDYAGRIGANRLFLDSNTKLIPAITLYRKVGFKEIPVPTDTPYERCNIRMELYL
ncbi:MAG: GNAT family N-acetyltransferase [Lutibacter sp.]|nr:GNAT family N-acetyltransferase [Lutibacter sp.]